MRSIAALNRRLNCQPGSQKAKGIVCSWLSLFLSVFFCVTAVAAPNAATSAGAITGVWMTPKGKACVRIYRSKDGEFSGEIIWLRDATYPKDFVNRSLAGKPRVDHHNPDATLRGRPLLGLHVLDEFTYFSEEDVWAAGRCYNPEDGETYKCELWLSDNGRILHVRGYFGIFYKTQTWTRGALSVPSQHVPDNR